MTRVSALAPLKALALVVFLAAIAGATYGVQSILGDNVSGQLFSVEAEKPLLNATGGHTVTYPVSITNRGIAERAVTLVLTGPQGLEMRGEATVGATSNTTLFLPLQVPEGLAPGTYAFGLRLLDEEGAVLRQRDEALTLRILEPATGYEARNIAQVLYTGRLADSGRVFNTNDPALSGAGFPKTENFQFSPGVLEVRGLPQPNVFIGFYEGVVGMQPGESRTVTFGPEKGDGNATVDQTLPRTSEIVRRESLPLPPAQLSMQDFDGFLQQTNQGRAADYEVGDFIRTERDGRELRYRIEEKTEESVSLRLYVEVGETYTIYPFWPNASRVVEVSGTEATFETTPTTAEGQGFTYAGPGNPHAANWPDTSRVVSMNETTIVIRHDPNVGLQYTYAPNQFQQARLYTVKSVNDESIVVSTASTRPLAGRTLTFDIEVLSIS